MLNKLQPPAQDGSVTGSASYLMVAAPNGDTGNTSVMTYPGGITFETHDARPEAFDYVCLVLLLLVAACFGAVLGFVYGKKHGVTN
jgi:hypothetical protein